MSIRYLSWISRNRALAFLIWVVLLSCVSTASASDIPLAVGPSDPGLPWVPPVQEGVVTGVYKERLLEVDINGQKLDQTVLVLEDKEGVLYLWAADLRRWRFHEPLQSSAIEYQAQQYYPLSAISDVSHVYDAQKLTLTLQVRPEAFSMTTRTSQYTNLPLPTRSGPGGFMNYDLFAANSVGVNQQSGQFEVGYFNSLGVGTSSMLAQNLGNSSSAIRLDSTWTTDFPDKMETLRLGDVISTPGTWGHAVRFGGIQFGRNFGTQPGFITYPMQGIVGQAVLPSTVDVFINNALVSRQTVPPGPFSIRNLPIVTGAGQVQLVVRDLFGRQQIINQPFYASQALLSKDLDSFSYELGVIRDNFGINSNDYHDWLGSANYRRGLSSLFTGELHAEAMQSQQAVGIGGDYLVPQIGTFSTYAAGSHGRIAPNYVAPQIYPFITYPQASSIANSGALVMLGIDRLAQPWSFSGRTQWASSGFAQVGQQALQLAPARLTSANMSYTMGSIGSVGVAYVSQINRDQPNTRIATVSYSVSVGRLGSFSVSVLRDFAGNVGTTLFSMFSISLDASTSASFSAQSSRGGSAGNANDLTATLQRNLPSGDGYGYLVQARNDNSSQASYSLQNSVGTYMVGVAQDQGSTATRLNATGGIAFLEGDAFMSRRIDQSFAVASIPDYPDVGVLADNQPVARTNSKGNALIPRLRAYDRNIISIDQIDLPLDARIQAVKVEAVPYYRSGVVVKFPIERSYGATFTIQLDDGAPLPVGAAVEIDGKDDVYTVGYDGEVYVVGLSPTTHLHATWKNQSCKFEVNYIASSDPLPDLGTVICKGVTP